MPQPGRLRQLWYRWKALDLPWRKQWLRGVDLAGNTFWEFKETYGTQRFRRIVKYSRRTHFGDVKLTPNKSRRELQFPQTMPLYYFLPRKCKKNLAKILARGNTSHFASTPQWIQWLRHTRADPPTVAEQQLDEIRQVRLKQLAAEADARWAAKPSALDPPSQSQTTPGLQPREPAAYAPQTEPEEKEGVRNAVDQVEASTKGEENVDKGKFKGDAKEKAPPPWQEPISAQEWQPEPWAPKIARRR